MLLCMFQWVEKTTPQLQSGQCQQWEEYRQWKPLLPWGLPSGGLGIHWETLCFASQHQWRKSQWQPMKRWRLWCLAQKRTKTAAKMIAAEVIVSTQHGQPTGRVSPAGRKVARSMFQFLASTTLRMQKTQTNLCQTPHRLSNLPLRMKIISRRWKMTWLSLNGPNIALKLLLKLCCSHWRIISY